MQLKKVKIKNFRSIEDLEIELNPPCGVLVGINESGKSNIFQALDGVRLLKSEAQKRIEEILAGVWG